MSGSVAEADGGSPRKKVLILTYYWPPAGGPGVQRFLKFARYLRNFGWDPIIVTPEEGSYPYLDETLAADIPEGLEIIKTGTLEPFAIYNRLSGRKGKSVTVGMIGYRDSQSLVQRFAKYVRANFFIPDARIGWKRYAVKAAMKRIKEGDVDAIISTGPPHSTHLSGLELQKKTGLPWLADFRDPWTTIYYNAYFPRSEATKRKDQGLENSVLQKADKVVVISQGMRREFEDRSECEVIYNGFDEEDLYKGATKADEHFRLCYIGNMKPNQNVPAIWEAVRQLAEANADFRRDFRFHFTGILDPGVKDSIEALGIGDLLKIDGFVPHKEATERMAQAGMLLFIIPNTKDRERIITGKIFEYLACETQMLSVGPQSGDAARILEEAGRPAMLDYEDVDAIRNLIEQGYKDWLAGNRLPLKYSDGDYMKFSRRALTGELAKQLEAMTSK